MGRTIVPGGPGSRTGATRPALAILSPMATKHQAGPGGAAQEGQVGRAGRDHRRSAVKSAEESGRYTPPIPKSVTTQPAVVWASLILVLFLIGGAGRHHSTTWPACPAA